MKIWFKNVNQYLTRTTRSGLREKSKNSGIWARSLHVGSRGAKLCPPPKKKSGLKSNLIGLSTCYCHTNWFPQGQGPQEGIQLGISECLMYHCELLNVKMTYFIKTFGVIVISWCHDINNCHIMVSWYKQNDMKKMSLLAGHPRSFLWPYCTIYKYGSRIFRRRTVHRKKMRQKTESNLMNLT